MIIGSDDAVTQLDGDKTRRFEHAFRFHVSRSENTSTTRIARTVLWVTVGRGHGTTGAFVLARRRE